MNVEVKIVTEGAELPKRATSGSAGYDLKALITKPLDILPGECVLVPTGLAMHIKDPNIVGIIAPRSKAGAKRGLVVGNLVGIIDSDYQGEWFVAAWNRNFDNSITIEPNEAIAQALFIPLASVSLVEVDAFSSETSRKDGGISKDADTR